MITPAVMKSTLAAVALAALYSIASVVPTRDCLTAEAVITAQANAWHGISLFCNDTVRLARLEARGLRISGIE